MIVKERERERERERESQRERERARERQRESQRDRQREPMQMQIVNANFPEPSKNIPTVHSLFLIHIAMDRRDLFFPQG